MSDLRAALIKLAERVRDHLETIKTEEAAKTSVVLPFLRALGYDVFNPDEVVPEFVSDAVGKKGEKVDYAIFVDGEVQILVECKGLSTELDRKHASQLFRYFSVTNAKFAVLTNAQQFEFYTDLDRPNTMDDRPFFSFNLLDFTEGNLSELQKFTKSNFDVPNILATAERLKYVSLVKKYLVLELETPSEELVRLVSGSVYEGRVTAQVREVVGAAIKSAHREILRDEVRSRLSSALADSSSFEDEELSMKTDGDGIETTQEEIDGTLIAKAIVRDVIDVSRIDMRDAKSYCSVLVDNNNRKPLVRLWFNRGKKYIGLFDGDSEEKVLISSLDKIYDYSDRLRTTALKYV